MDLRRVSFALRLASLACAAGLALAAAAAAQQPGAASAADAARTLAVDPQVTIDTLPNGVRYYVRVNRKPEKRAELRLVVNAGSVLEDEDQRGLAHMVEHMAFNGTQHFVKNELVSYLESIGMRFGPDINAFTSLDETVYMLQLPTDSASAVEKGFEILEDWARGVAFDPAEVDKERGVVIEEWRLGRGAEQRMFDKQLPILLRGSRYAQRLPIGSKESLETFKPAALTRFYRDWYRSDLMAVVAVGDFDKATIERLVRLHFGGIPAAKSPRARTVYDVPGHDSTLFAIATDKEATGTSVVVYHKQPRSPQGTVRDYRRELLEALYNAMLNQRFYELTQTPEAPFIFAGSSQSRFVGPGEVYVLSASVKDNGVERGLEALLTEAERVERHGFTQTELEREEQDMLRGLERAHAERDKTESGQLAAEYVNHFLEGEPIPGIAYEYELAKHLLPTIQLAEVNRLAREWITERNRVITVQVPDKPGVKVPTATALRAVIAAVGKKDVAVYKDATPTAPLLDKPPAGGTIAATKALPEIGVTQWTLSNGVRVILKPTELKADEVRFRAYSPGGSSLLPDAEIAAAGNAVAVVSQGGLGRFNQVELGKALAGKAVGVTATIGGLEEGLFGNGSPKDLETLFQLIYLHFTAPRADSTAVLAFKTRFREALVNRGARPEEVLRDTLQVTLSQHHVRARPISPALVDSLDLKKSMAFYKDRFADASDFTFVFVGNFEPDSIKSLVQTYLGALPSLKRKETWRDTGIRPPTGVVSKTVRRGTEPKAQTQIVFTGPFAWERQNRYALASLGEVLRIRLREVLREELGGTYGVTVGASSSRDPKPRYSLSVSFGSAPERAEVLSSTVFAQIDSLKKAGPTAQEIEKVRETQRREDEVGKQQNEYWLATLAFADRYGEDPRVLLDTDKLHATLSADLVKRAAHQYLRADNYVKVVLLPEGGTGAAAKPE